MTCRKSPGKPGSSCTACAKSIPAWIGVRGRGLIFGMECSPPELADAITTEAFQRGVIVETSGADSQVVKLLPPLTIEMETLKRGLSVLGESLAAALQGFPQYARQLKEVSA